MKSLEFLRRDALVLFLLASIVWLHPVRAETGCAGRLDVSFVPPTDIYVPACCGREAFVAAQRDGKVLVAGSIFGEKFAVIRLRPDGSRDTSFTTFGASGAPSECRAPVRGQSRSQEFRAPSRVERCTLSKVCTGGEPGRTRRTVSPDAPQPALRASHQWNQHDEVLHHPAPIILLSMILNASCPRS